MIFEMSVGIDELRTIGTDLFIRSRERRRKPGEAVKVPRSGFLPTDEAVSRSWAAKIFKDGARLVPPFHSSRQCDLVASSMKLVEYQDLYRKLATPEDIDFLAENAGYDKELLLVIYTQRIVRETTKKFYRVKAQARRLAFMWQNGSSLLEIARKFEFPPILTALMVLEQRKISRKQFWKMINDLASVKDRSVRRAYHDGNRAGILYSPPGAAPQHPRGPGGAAKRPPGLRAPPLPHRRAKD